MNTPEVPRQDSGVFCAVWYVRAPWAHPLWSDYLVTLVDLTTVATDAGDGSAGPILYGPDVTHEVVVQAVDPQLQMPANTTIVHSLHQQLVRTLSPPNYAYQFKAETDAAAQMRIQAIVDLIERRELSPDTDFVAQWNRLFTDAVSLRR